MRCGPFSDAVWDEDKMIGRYHGLVGEDLGDPQGVLIFDETGFGRRSKAVQWKLGQGA